MNTERWRSKLKTDLNFMSWWNVCRCTYPSCRGCLWRSTWEWRQCLDRKEVSACHSPPDPLCPREPTPPDGHMKRGQREEQYDVTCDKEAKGEDEKFILHLITFVLNLVQGCWVMQRTLEAFVCTDILTFMPFLPHRQKRWKWKDCPWQRKRTFMDLTVTKQYIQHLLPQG